MVYGGGKVEVEIQVAYSPVIVFEPQVFTLTALTPRPPLMALPTYQG